MPNGAFHQRALSTVHAVLNAIGGTAHARRSDTERCERTRSSSWRQATLTLA